jgi:signal transduction histidine kinase
MAAGGSEVEILTEQVARLREQLAQAQKQTALGELVSTTTHEFNNVLMTILNYAKLGLKHPTGETATKSFEKILSAANRAARITNGILGFARNRTGNFEATDMVKVIDDTLLLLERDMMKYRVHVERKINPAPPAMANTNQIQQVLLNILINARQAMSSGGTIFVTLGHDPVTDMVEVSVRDTGCGMTHETLQRIFEPYYTTKAGPDETGRGGTGLGLSMCRDILEAHHGKIRVESAPGAGTAFTLRIPSARPITQAGAPPREAFMPPISATRAETRCAATTKY